jgi:hypothetical protein
VSSRAVQTSLFDPGLLARHVQFPAFRRISLKGLLGGSVELVDNALRLPARRTDDDERCGA